MKDIRKKNWSIAVLLSILLTGCAQQSSPANDTGNSAEENTPPEAVQTAAPEPDDSAAPESGANPEAADAEAATEEANNAENAGNAETPGRELSEVDLIAIAEDYGIVYQYAYGDFDRNGSFEMFAAITSPESISTLKHVVYIDAQGNLAMMRENFELSEVESTMRQTEYNGEYFCSLDIGAGGSGWVTLLYSVQNNIPYELDISRNLQGFYVEDGRAYTTYNDFSSGTHEYPEVDLILENHQFHTAEEIPQDEPQPAGDWSRDYPAVLEAFKNSDEYSDTSRWELYDFAKDGTPELVISTGDYHAGTCQLYGYDGTAYQRLTSVSGWDTFGAYGEIEAIPGTNQFYVYDIGQGVEFFGFYTIQGMTIMQQDSFMNNVGQYGEESASYYINDEPVSQSAYEAAFEKYSKLVDKSVSVGSKRSFSSYDN